MFYDKINYKNNPVYFDSLSERDQLEIIDRYTKAAQEGIPEFKTDGSGNTIVHDIIHLHSDKLFRIVFKQGCPLLNTCNSQGSTPLLEAISANDESLVREMLKGNITKSINQPNHNGITPLHAAIDRGNANLVQLLLEQGAVLSINSLDARKMSPLHIAASLKNKFFVKILIQHGAKDSITIQDSRGYTPFQRAIISSRFSAVNLMLKVNPDLAKTLNLPDSHGVTDLQRAARSGNMKMMRLLLLHAMDEEIKLNPDACFTEEDLESCLAVHSKDRLEAMSIDDVAFPLTIAQNSCNVMVRLKNDKILKIPNADAKQVRTVLLKKKFGPEVLHREGLNILTFYMNTGHAFLRLECSKCDNGRPYNMNTGFWGNQVPLPDPGAPSSENVEIVPEDLQEEVGFAFLQTAKNFIPTKERILNVGLISLPILFPRIRRHAALPSGMIASGFMFLSDLAFNIANKMLSTTIMLVFKNSHKLTQNPLKGVVSSGSAFGMHKLAAPHVFYLLEVNKRRQMEEVGAVGNDDEHEKNSDSSNALKIMFHISDKQAKDALDTIKKVNTSCHENPAAFCRYQLIGHNCMDFVQDIFESAGGIGDFASYFTDHQLRASSMAPSYGYSFLRSRNISFVTYRFGETINKISNTFAPYLGWEMDSYAKSHPIPKNFVDYSSFVEPAAEGNLSSMYVNATSYTAMVANRLDPENHVTSIQEPLTNQLMLGAVLGRTIITAYHFVSQFWDNFVGEKTTEEEFSLWYTQQENELDEAFHAIDSMIEIINENLELIDNEINQLGFRKENATFYTFEEKVLLDAFLNEKKKWMTLKTQNISLDKEGMNLKAELYFLSKRIGLPTKKYLSALQEKVSAFSERKRNLIADYIKTYNDL